VYISKPFTDYTADDYALVTGVNLTGFFWVTQRAIAEMARRHGGHVVNISATLAAATRSLAIEYASRVASGRPHQPSKPPTSGRRARALIPTSVEPP
jgi:NAD(P)-dependent dehydrogenase (short-subunit alcohol dehydrogenase family)